MPDNLERTPIQIAWIDFVSSVKVLLVPQTDDRPLDQYLAFRDAVLPLVQSEQFLADLNVAWPLLSNQPEIQNAIVLELQAFPRAVEVGQATQKPEESRAGWGKMLSRASTVSGSVKDLLENLPPYAKNAITLFKEMIDLFKGKD